MKMRIKEIGNKKTRTITTLDTIKGRTPIGEWISETKATWFGLENTDRIFETFPIEQILDIFYEVYNNAKLFEEYYCIVSGKLFFNDRAIWKKLTGRHNIVARDEVIISFLINELKLLEIHALLEKLTVPLYIREIKKKTSYGKTEQYTDEKDCYVLYNQKIYQLDKFSYSIDQIKELVNSLDVREIQDFVNISKRTAAIKTGTTSPRVEISEEVRQIVWIRDGGRCVRCHTNKKLVYAHIIPHVDGGSNTERNIEMLCEDCNNKQGANVQYEGDLFQ